MGNPSSKGKTKAIFVRGRSGLRFKQREPGAIKMDLVAFRKGFEVSTESGVTCALLRRETFQLMTVHFCRV